MRASTTALAAVAAGVAVAAAARNAVRAKRRFSFANKVALITGGSRGLGLAVAEKLADEGAKIAICARDPEEVRAAERVLQELGADVLACVCDVTQKEQVQL